MSNVAAIDLGSNSCRLVIANNKGEYLYTKATSAKLAEGMSENMLLTAEAMARTIDILTEFANKIKEFDVKKYRAITTAAVRQAKNGAEFVKLIKNKTELDFEVIDEFEEARLNLVGAIGHALGKSCYVCVFDIGGASTEVTIATNEAKPTIIKTTSIPYGGRNGKEDFNLIEYNHIGAEQLRLKVKEYINDFVLPSDTIVLATSSVPLRLLSFIYNKEKYNRNEADGLIVNKKQLDNSIENIYKMTQPEMAKNPNIGENRSYIFIPAVIILQTIVETLKIEELTASLLSAKDAIIKELINE